MVTQYHYNPEKYLKGFASPAESLFMYSKYKQSFIPENGGNYKNFGSKRHLYLEKFEIEYFDKIDSNFVTIRNKLSNYVLEGQSVEFTREDFMNLAMFVSSQPFRTPTSRGILSKAYKEFPPPSGELKDEELREKFGKHIEQYTKIILPKLGYSKIVLCVAPESIPFITSDNVATLFRRSDLKGFPGFTAAYLDPGTQIYFPLSSRLCLWIGSEREEVSEKEIRSYDITSKHTAFINSVIYGNCTEYAYSGNKESLINAVAGGKDLPKCKTSLF